MTITRADIREFIERIIRDSNGLMSLCQARDFVIKIMQHEIFDEADKMSQKIASGLTIRNPAPDGSSPQLPSGAYRETSEVRCASVTQKTHQTTLDATQPSCPDCCTRMREAAGIWFCPDPNCAQHWTV